MDEIKSAWQSVNDEASPFVSLEGDFDWWRGHAAQVFNLAPMYSAENTGHFTYDAYFCDHGVFAQTRYDAVAMERTADHMPKTRGVITITRYVSGGPLFFVPNIPKEKYPGTIVLSDYGQPSFNFHTATTAQLAMINKSSLGIADDDIIPSILVPGGSELSKQFNRLYDDVFERVQAHQDLMGRPELEAFFEFVTGVIDSNNKSGDIRRRARHQLYDKICEFIYLNLTDNELSAQQLMETFGVSRASLYRMFQADGGLKTFITRRRLFRAALEIAEDPSARGRIVFSAQRWGFDSLSNFNRLVHKTFGTSPSTLFPDGMRGVG